MTAFAALVAAIAVAGTQVSLDYRSLPGHQEPHTPKRYNETFYLRYHNHSKTNTILVLMPGVFMGSTAFDGLARQLVAQTSGIEVWAVDRRSNQIESRAVSRDALRKRDGSSAYAQLVTHAGTPGAFQPAVKTEVQFMAHWGLDTHLQDLHRVVLAARKRATRVIVGGHSLGASVTSLYVAAKIEPGKTGQNFVDGLILLDGLVGRTGGGAGADITKAVSDLKAGKTDVYNAGVTRYLVEREARNLMAALAPAALAPTDFIAFPASNLAVAGLFESPNTSPLPLLSSSVGESAGARVSDAPRPAGSVLRIAPGLRNVAGLVVGSQRIEWRTGPPGDHRLT
jgi:pimeloyl-ACP methyl ester carboxylesterase